MSIRRRSDGQYIIRFYADGTKKSSWRQETLGYISRDEAVRIYRERTALAAARKGRALHSITFETLAAAYLESAGRKMAEKSRQRAEEIIDNHLKPRFGPMLIPSIRPFHIEQYMDARIDAKATRGTVNREWNVMKAVLNWGEKMELIERNPIRRGSVSTLKVSDAKLIYFEPEEWRKFIAAFDDPEAWKKHVATIRHLGPIKNGEQGERRYGAGRRPDSKATAAYLERLRQTVPVFKALLYTGCRLNEILSLRWCDLDLKRRAITVMQQKTRRQKVLPIAPELLTLLQALPRGIGDACVFTRADGLPFATIEVQRAFGIARKLSRIRAELTPHSIRHTFASWLAIAGQPLRTIQELLGHADIRMTIRYSHLSPTHLSDAIRTIGAVAAADAKSGRGQRESNADQKG